MFGRTLGAWQAARELGLKMQVNTTITGHIRTDLADIAGLVSRLEAVSWSAFLLVPIGWAPSTRSGSSRCRPAARAGRLAGIHRTSPLFTGMRDQGKLAGRCGACEFAPVCGGSRSRAFALAGDLYAEDPWCCYQPGTFPCPDNLAAVGLRSAE